MRRRTLLASLAAAFAPSRAFARSPKALSGDRLRIGAQDYQLADILAPSAYAISGGPAPYFEESKTELDMLLANSPLQIEKTKKQTRWGADVIHAPLLQDKLVAAGAARVAPNTDNRNRIEALLAIEQKARGARKGLWALETYQVYDADNAEGAIGAYHLIEGIVTRAQEAKSRFYLNFGDDFRTDFTATAKSSVCRKWARAGFDLKALKGVRLRVRGFVAAIHGPSVELTHQQQVEILTD